MYTDAELEAVQAFIGTSELTATQRLLAANWEILTSPKIRGLLAYQLGQHESTTLEYWVIAARLAAVERALTDGLEATFADYEAATGSVLALLNAPDWAETERALRTHLASLMSDITDVAFADLILGPMTEAERSHVKGGWSLIRRCRTVGVDAAIAEQRRGHRGYIIGADTTAELANASSPDDVTAILRGEPGLGQAIEWTEQVQQQLASWSDFDSYTSAYSALDQHDVAGKADLAEAALERVDRTTLPAVWAAIALDLAGCYRDLVADQERPDLSRSIELWQAALQIIPRHGDVDQWGRTHRELGKAYLRTSAGSIHENTERAIDAVEAALSVSRPMVEPIEWAEAATNLAEALRRRSSPDPSADLDRAAQLAADVVDRLEELDEGRLLNGARVTLGVMLQERITGARGENRRRAEEQFRLVLETWEPDYGPDAVVLANLNLGTLAWQQSRDELWRHEELLELAEGHFRAALVHALGPGHVHHRAIALQGLGLVASDRIQAGVAEYENAVEHLDAALDLLRQIGSPAGEMGVTHRSLGAVYLERTDGDRDEHLARAAEHFRASLDALDAATEPNERRHTLRALGSLHFEQREWQLAHDRFQEATDLADEVLGGIVAEPGRRAEVAADRSLFSRDAYCLIRLGRPGEALARLDQGMARMLTDHLLLEAAAAEADEPHESSVAWALSEIRRLDSLTSTIAAADAGQSADIGRRLGDAYRLLGDVLGTDACGQSSFADLLTAIPAGGALVAPLVTSEGGAVLVVPAGVDAVTQANVVDLPHLTVAGVGEMLGGTGGDGGWLNAQIAYANERAEVEDLQRALDLLVSDLHDSLVGPVRHKLHELGVPNDSPVVVLPQGWLSLLPLHAAMDASGTALLDEYAVSVAPSIASLGATADRLSDPARSGRTLLAVANPTGDLDFAEREVSEIMATFRTVSPDGDHLALPGPAATRAHVLDGLRGRQYCHFACHGEYEWADPDRSRLLLANGHLTVRDILSPAADFGSARVVMLSACETGMTEFRTMPDEFVGFAGAFLNAGATVVVSSLWPVDDLSTKFVMGEFYRRHLAGDGVVESLRGATRWIRRATADELGLAHEYRTIYESSDHEDVEALELAEYYEQHPDAVPMSHPFYWAAFTAVGLPDISRDGPARRG